MEKIKIGLQELKEIELEILKKFDSFCNNHQLRYFLACGTLLGAVRHKGFIPWDDDIDVYMPRRDYMSFLEMTRSSFDSYYRVISPYNSKNYIYTYAKICDTRTVLVEFPETLKYKIGVYIDVFPVDGLPDSLAESDDFFLKMRKLIYKNWLFGAQCHIYRKSPDMHVRTYGYLINLAAVLLGRDYYFKKLDKKARKYDFDKCEYVGLTAAGYGRVERIKQKCFSSFRKVQFENNLFNSPLCSHEYLTNLYRNYMEFPPEEQRVKRHDNEAYWNEEFIPISQNQVV